MEKRLAASAAGLTELALLREKHQREVEQLLASMAHKANDATVTDIDEPPPPLPPRWQAPAQTTRLCHSVSDVDDAAAPDDLTHRRSSCPERHHDDLDRSSTFRRPRRVSESTVYTYPSPMHAVLMQYTNSDTKPRPCVNEQGFLETTFPAGGDEPVCGHCHSVEKSCGAHGSSCNTSSPSPSSSSPSPSSPSDSQHSHESSPGPVGLPPSGFRRKPSPLVCDAGKQVVKEQRTEQPNRRASPKGRKSRNSRNLSSLSEEGYFSCCSELSFNAQTQSDLSSLFSNDSCCHEDMPSEAADNQACEKYFVVSNDGKPNVYCFKEEVEYEDQVFV